MHQLLEDDIVVPGLIAFENGCIRVPDRPGLGIELDEELVEKYSELYRSSGPFYNEPAQHALKPSTRTYGPGAAGLSSEHAPVVLTGEAAGRNRQTIGEGLFGRLIVSRPT